MQFLEQLCRNEIPLFKFLFGLKEVKPMFLTFTEIN